MMKIQKSKKMITLTLCGLLVSSCASQYQRPESAVEKMSRYKARSFSQNSTPTLPLIEATGQADWFQTSTKASRAPASVSTVETSSEEQNQNVDQSHKRLYFLTLYSQFEQLQQFSNEFKAQELRVCPHFHSSLVTHRESYSGTKMKMKKNRQYSDQLISEIQQNESKIHLYPELALPLTADTLKPRVFDILAQKGKSEQQKQTLVEQAIAIHLTKAYSELSELCEFGSSDNYYIYENLMSSIEREGGLEKNAQGLQVLLKTSLMFNHALITSISEQKQTIRTRAPASAMSTPTEAYTNEIIKRMKATWAQTYYKKLEQN